jgi:hypothetical protein
MIRTGTTEQALLAAVAHLFPDLSPAVGGPAAHYRSRDAGCEKALGKRSGLAK